MMCFELVSGLKINFHKSKLAGIEMTEQETRRLAGLLNCRIMKLPFTYLGLSVGGNLRRLSLWEPVLAKLRGRLPQWRQKTLSFGGRITLISSVLSALPLFYLCFYKMPQGIILKCNRIMRNFLWGGTEGDTKVAWIKWKVVCSPKENGGLGMRDWGVFYKALLGKWRWRILNEQASLWVRILKAKYAIPVQHSHVNIEDKMSLWWKDILRSCFGDNEGAWFDLNMGLKLGEGICVSFLHVPWMGQEQLKDKFVRLYYLSLQ